VALLELDIAVLVQMSLGREFHKAMVRSSKRFQSSNRDVYQVTLSQLFPTNINSLWCMSKLILAVYNFLR
jgi:hypothetical protein